jgi:type II secretory pathway pseudopilin PulG
MIKKVFSFEFPVLTQKGQMLVELILAIGIAAVILPALLTGLYASSQSKPQQQQRTQAVALLQQSEAAVRSMKNSSWSTFANDGTYHTTVLNNQWTLAANAQTVNGLTQQVVVSDVYRNSSDAIVTTGGTLDPSTKQVTITVSWTKPTASNITDTLYLSRTTNLTYTQTTQSDFAAGTLSSAQVTNTSGGEVELGAGNANWCTPQNAIVNTLTLPLSGNAITAATGSAYIGMGSGVSGPIFADLAISTPPPPATPSASVVATYTGTSQTNAVYSDGTYAYLAVNGTSSQVMILKITSKPYTLVKTINLPSNTNANGIYVYQNILYVTSSNVLYTYNISNIASPVLEGSSQMWLGIGNTPLAKQVIVQSYNGSNYALVGTANTLFGLQKFLVSSDGTSMRLVGVSNLSWQQSSQGLAVNSTGTRAYIAFDQGQGFFPKGFFIVDTSPADPPSWWPFPNWYNIISTFNGGNTDPDGMAVMSAYNRALLVGSGGTYQYQVIDISNENNPVLCGGLSLSAPATGVTGVTDQYNNVYSYLITGESKNQFKIIQGGSGGNFASSGTFESGTFNPGYSAAYNRFSATVSQPTNTSIQMQIASAPPFNGSCTGASYNYVGPNGSSTNYFTPSNGTISGIIPFGTYNSTYQNPGQCFRYKVWMSTSDTSTTPVLYDMTTNYSQ